MLDKQGDVFCPRSRSSVQNICCSDSVITAQELSEPRPALVQSLTWARSLEEIVTRPSFRLLNTSRIPPLPDYAPEHMASMLESASVQPDIGRAGDDEAYRTGPAIVAPERQTVNRLKGSSNSHETRRNPRVRCSNGGNMQVQVTSENGVQFQVCTLHCTSPKEQGHQYISNRTRDVPHTAETIAFKRSPAKTTATSEVDKKTNTPSTPIRGYERKGKSKWQNRQRIEDHRSNVVAAKDDGALALALAAKRVARKTPSITESTAAGYLLPLYTEDDKREIACQILYNGVQEVCRRFLSFDKLATELEESGGERKELNQMIKGLKLTNNCMKDIVDFAEEHQLSDVEGYRVAMQKMVDGMEVRQKLLWDFGVKLWNVSQYSEEYDRALSKEAASTSEAAKEDDEKICLQHCWWHSSAACMAADDVFQD